MIKERLEMDKTPKADARIPMLSSSAELDISRDATYDTPDDSLRTSWFDDMGTPEVRMSRADVQRITDRRYISATKAARWLVFNAGPGSGPTPEDYAAIVVQNPRTGARIAARLANVRNAVFASI